jgi:hypothetical protein
MKREAINGDVYERVLEHCARFKFTGMMSFVTVDSSVYSCPIDPAAMLAQLLQEFGEEAVIESGTALRNDDGGLAIVAGLTAPAGIFIAMRSSEGSQPFDLMTAAGCVADERPAVAVALEDQMANQKEFDFELPLLIAFSMADVVVFRALGMPAAIAAGLDRLSPSAVDVLCEALRVKRPKLVTREELQSQFDSSLQTHVPGFLGADAAFRGMASGAPRSGGPVHAHPSDKQTEPEQADVDPISSSDSPPLTGPTAYKDPDEERLDRNQPRPVLFVGWSPADLNRELPTNLRGVSDHFCRLRGYLGIDLDNIDFWQPAAAEIERLKYFAQHREHAWFRQRLQDSLEDSTKALCALTTGSPASLSLTETMHRLLKSAYGNSASQLGNQDCDQQWREFVRLLDEQLIGRLRDEGDIASRPQEAVLWYTLAGLTRVVITQEMSVTLSSARLDLSRDEQQAATPSRVKFAELLSGTDRIISLAREIESCQQSRSFDTARKFLDVPIPARALRASD